MNKAAAGLAAATLLAGFIGLVNSGEADKKAVAPALNFKMKRLDGKEADLSAYQGKVVLIVNVASKCGLTPQYTKLQALHDKYAEKGLAILGFPCNQFLGQEPGSAADISKTCHDKYGVEFDMFSKIEVNGDNRAPLYAFLTSKTTNPKYAGDITWNFEKFLINRQGEVVARFGPKVEPDATDVVEQIETELARK